MPEDVSQKVTSIIADLEDAFGIEIPDEDALRVRSVREVVDSLRKALEARGRGPAQA